MSSLENKKAPAFKLPNQDGEIIQLKDLVEDYVVLFFYPKDNTPGCTIEAKEFTASKKDFKKVNALAIGISGGDEKTKQKFCKKAELDVTLLSDTDGAVGVKYDCYGEKKFMGRTFIGFHRKTFIIGPDRKIIKVYEKVKPEGHSEEVLRFIKSL